MGPGSYLTPSLKRRSFLKKGVFLFNDVDIRKDIHNLFKLMIVSKFFLYWDKSLI